MKAKVLGVLLFVLTYSKVIGQNAASVYTQNAKGLCDGIYLDINALITDRTPTLNQIKFASNIQLPSKCLSNLNDKLIPSIENYNNQDKRNLQNIVNNYCSHMKGWVEYNPGTCQAGGPPPICPANHWYQNPSKAMDEFYNERNRVYNERLKELEVKKKELLDEACNCWLVDLKETGFKLSFVHQSQYQSDNKQLYQTTNIKIQCLNGTCPIGFKCADGYCIESSVQGSFKNNTTLNYESQGLIKDKVKDIAIDKILDFAKDKFESLTLVRGLFKTATSNPYAVFIKGILKSTNLGTFSSIYQQELIKAQSNANQLEKLYDEQRRFKHNLTMTTANVQQRKNEIAKYRSELGKNIFNINDAVDGIGKEKELGTCNCYNVLQYNNTLVIETLTNVMNKNLEW